MTKKKSDGRATISSAKVGVEFGASAVAVVESPIRKTKGICGGKARIAGTRIPVWGLENARRLGLSAREILERYPSVSKKELAAAWEYAAKHKAEIDRQIRESQES